MIVALTVLLAVGWVTAGLDPSAAPTGEALTVPWAIALGALQGATEFLPVSSSGHLAIGQALLGIDPATAGHRFSITLHAGTLIAVVWVYRADVRGLLRVLSRPTVASHDRRRLVMMLLASLPLGIVFIPGVEELVIAMETQVRWVGVALCTTAIILFFAFRGDRGATDEPSLEPPTPRQAFIIGLAQVFAVLPGISRSGSTIAAGLAVGLDRPSAARFSFLISLIAIGGASAKEALDIVRAPAQSAGVDVVAFGAGFATSLIVGLLSLRGLLFLVRRGRVGIFVVYLIIAGGAAIVLG